MCARVCTHPSLCHRCTLARSEEPVNVHIWMPGRQPPLAVNVDHGQVVAGSARLWLKECWGDDRARLWNNIVASRALPFRIASTADQIDIAELCIAMVGNWETCVCKSVCNMHVGGWSSCVKCARHIVHRRNAPTCMITLWWSVHRTNEAKRDLSVCFAIPSKGSQGTLA